MTVKQILEEYGLTRETATQYVDAITRMNQSQAAEALGVSRGTIHRYKNAFGEMTPIERIQLIASLTQNELLERAGSDE